VKTRLTELLNIEYPILCGGMFRIGRAPLVAAVAEAGGIGFITSAHYDTPEELRKDIRLARVLTKKQIGVNLTLSPRRKPLPNDEFINVLIDEGVRVVETTGRGIEKYVDILKKNEVKIIHKVAGVRYAKSAERIGADAVTIIGIEAGGHPGEADLGNLVLIPQTVDAVKIPVIAGGGIADGRGMAAALSLGAEGILMATRFMATQESVIHENVKQWMVGATELDTTLIQKSIGSTTRVSKNAVALEVLEAEQRKATVEELYPLINGERSKRVFFDGELDGGVWWCGSSVGLIHDLPTVKETIEQIIEETKQTLTRLNAYI
jgi:NADH:quinone reductase (non-electrogenic)